MSKADFFHSIKTGKPYFGPYVSCRKSWSHIYWYQQKLIKFISSKSKIDQINILEIGSWAGASSFSWCEGIDRYFKRSGSIICVDIWNSDETKNKSNLEEPILTIKEIFDHNISAGGYSDLVTTMQMTSDEAFESLTSKKFDLVYIDGDHTFEQAKQDIKNGSNIVNIGGYLCGDDLELQANQVDIKNLKRHISEGDAWGIDPKTRKGYHPGVTLAVADIFGQVPEWGGFWAIEKADSGWRNIELSDVEAFIPRPLMQYDHDGNQIFDL